jgi:hypothetical protein
LLSAVVLFLEQCGQVNTVILDVICCVIRRCSDNY